MVFLWITAYGLVYVLAARAAHLWVLPIAMLGYSAALIGWVVLTGQARRLGLCVPRNFRCFHFLPLLMLPVCNCLTAKAVSLSLPTFLLMLAASAAEELFFRGFLLRFLTRFGAIPAILISSVVFALFHLVNLTAGSALYTWAQVLCALTAGICFAAEALRSGSLLPGFGAHLLSNITAAPASAEPAPLVWFCAALYGCYGAILCKSFSFSKEHIL